MMFNTDTDCLKEKLKIIDKFYAEFGWIADSHILDFYVNQTWAKLPGCWQRFLEFVEPVEFGHWLIDENEGVRLGPQHIWPLGLQAFKATIKSLTLDRRQVDEVDLRKFLDSISSNMSVGNQPQALDKHVTDATKLFARHLTPKKQHEIQILTKAIQRLVKLTGAKSVFDIGSGVGHLTRHLTYACDLDVISVECLEEFTTTASKFDDTLAKNLSRKKAKFDSTKTPTRVLAKLGVNDSMLLPPMSEKFGLVGLHSCGDLTVTILNTFRDSSNAAFALSLGCCYFKLGNQGYPLSAFMASKACLSKFSYPALEVASHAIEAHADRLQRSEFGNLKIHCYRAALEFLIVRKYPALKGLGLKGVKEFENKGFLSYAKEALAYHPDVTFDDSDLDSPEVKVMLEDWWKVIVFYSIRLLMASLVESSILMDRVLFLRENGFFSTIVPLFNERISPRNLAIFAVRTTLVPGFNSDTEDTVMYRERNFPLFKKKLCLRNEGGHKGSEYNIHLFPMPHNVFLTCGKATKKANASGKEKAEESLGGWERP